MNASLTQMVLAPWRQRDMDAPWSRRLLFALAAAGLATGCLLLPGTSARVMLVGTVGASIVFGIWIALIASLLEQNHPAAARLVPGHLRRLREAALAGWLPLPALMGLLVWGANHAVVPLSLPLVLLGSFTACAFVAWAQRWWQLWVAISIVPVFIGPLRLHVHLAPLWWALADVWQAQPWSVLALCVLAQGALLTRLFGAGDAVHHAAYARRRCMRRASLEAMTGHRSGPAAFGRVGEWLARPFKLACNAWLGHLLATASPRRGSVMARAEYVMHGQQHWLRHAMGTGVAMACVALGFSFAFALVGPHVGLAWQHGAVGMGIGLASAGFNPSLMLRGALWHSRREQALLALLPGMPQGAAQSRAVVWRQLRHFLLAWVLTTLALLVLAVKAGQPMLLCLSLAALPVGILTLVRAPARLRAPRAGAAVLPIVGFLGLGGLMWRGGLGLSLPVGALALFSLALSTALLARGWHSLAGAPAALPAGRMGQATG